MKPIEERYCWAPVMGGVGLGLIMILTFVVSGRGIGISGGLTRIAAWIQDRIFPGLTAKSEYSHGTSRTTPIRWTIF